MTGAFNVATGFGAAGVLVSRYPGFGVATLGCRDTILVSRQWSTLWVGFVSQHDFLCRGNNTSVWN